jgi:cytoskeletal protein CcmA (bactofilin family)
MPNGETVFRRRKPEPQAPSAHGGPIGDEPAVGPIPSSLFPPASPPHPTEAAPVKDTAPMSSTASASSAAASTAQAASPAGAGARNAPLPALRAPSVGRRESERRTLQIGRGMTVEGVIKDCERLIVEGVVETTLISAGELVVAPGGLYKGEADTEDADIAGTIDGTITARGSLVVRGTGKLVGTVRCRRLQVEDGGQISGQLEMIGDQPQRPSGDAAF